MCLLAVSIQAEVRDLQERLAIEKEAWEENYMKKQVCVYLCLFFLLVHYVASMCIGDCVYVPVRACVHVRMCVYMCVYPNHIAPLHRKPPYWLKRGNYERICDLKEIK